MNTNIKTFKFTYNEDCAYWSDNQDENLFFINSYEDYFTLLLRVKGYIYLEDILEKMGIPYSEEVGDSGYVLNDDDFIDFHLREEMDGNNFVLKFVVLENIYET